MRLLPDLKLNYSDVLIVPQRSDLDSRSDRPIDGKNTVDLFREYKFRHCKLLLNCIGIIASNMFNTGTINMTYALGEQGLLTALHKYHTLDDHAKILNEPYIDGKFFVTIGESQEDLDRLHRLHCYSHMCRLMVSLEVANAYRNSTVDFIKKIRDFCCETVVLMVGNVTTPEMVQELIMAGTDIVKIGIGPGSMCETRRVAGVGYGQFSAIVECANVAHGLGGHICADGGCKSPGDICKAFCAGADFVMLGGMFAGTDECDGEWIYNFDGDKKALKFFGMSSQEAMSKFGGEKEYRSAEGVSTWVDYKGPVSDIVKEILGGLRSCGTYIGAKSIKNFSKCATFCRIVGE